MTTRSNGRPAATTSSRPVHVLIRPVLLRLSVALALCVLAPGVLANPVVDDGAPFPVKAKPSETAVLAPVEAGSGPATRPSLTDRALGLAIDVNRLLSPLPLPAADATDDGKVRTVLQKALALLGTPYRWGGTDPDKGFDCSGLVGYVFRNALGVELPRVSRDMAKTGELITERAKLVAGDLVFFGRKGRVDHVGIYVGDGRFVHAPSRGKDVTVSSLEQGYWSGRFMQARRVDTDGI